MNVDIILNEFCTPQEVAELAALAESYGFRTIWSTSYAEYRDPFMNLCKAAETTSKIKLGVMAVSPYELHPVKMAMSLFTLNEMSNGRASIVVGGGGGVIGVMGISPEHRVGHVKECVEILRAAMGDEPVNYDGTYYKASRYRPAFLTQSPPEIQIGASKPQMLTMATRLGDGLMMSDIMPVLLEENMKTIKDGLTKNERSQEDFIVNNFWAWHIKEDKADSIREARIELIYRGWLVRRYLEPFLSEEDVELVLKNKMNFLRAAINHTPEIEGIPDHIINTLLDAFTSTGSIDDIDREIERFRKMNEMGMTDIALRVHENQADSIKLIGERLLPALRD